MKDLGNEYGMFYKMKRKIRNKIFINKLFGSKEIQLVQKMHILTKSPQLSQKMR